MDLNLAGVSTARLLRGGQRGGVYHVGGLDCQGRHLPRLAPAQLASLAPAQPAGEQDKGEHGHSATTRAGHHADGPTAIATAAFDCRLALHQR